jgi:hypothetical protein
MSKKQTKLFRLSSNCLLREKKKFQNENLDLKCRPDIQLLPCIQGLIIDFIFFFFENLIMNEVDKL